MTKYYCAWIGSVVGYSAKGILDWRFSILGTLCFAIGSAVIIVIGLIEKKKLQLGPAVKD